MTAALRRLGATRPLEPAVALVLRALCVRESARFVARELARSRALGAYHVRGSGLPVFIRHRSPDVVTLGEVFHRPDYEPPPDVDALLAARGPALRILDLGANVGLFGVFAAARWPRATVTAVEPDPANLAVLRRCVQAAGRGERWTVVAAAAAASGGSVPFEAGGASLSRIAPGGAARVAAVDALALLDGVDLLKMDIEGAEYAVIDDLTAARTPVGQFLVEYHHRFDGVGAARTAVSIRDLRRAGYRLFNISESAEEYSFLGDGGRD